MIEVWVRRHGLVWVGWKILELLFFESIREDLERSGDLHLLLVILNIWVADKCRDDVRKLWDGELASGKLDIDVDYCEVCTRAAVWLLFLPSLIWFSIPTFSEAAHPDTVLQSCRILVQGSFMSYLCLSFHRLIQGDLLRLISNLTDLLSSQAVAVDFSLQNTFCPELVRSQAASCHYRKNFYLLL